MIPGVPRPCIDCNTLTHTGSRCRNCQQQLLQRITINRPPRPHYAGDYKRRAKHIRETATHCHICGDGPRPNDPWQADHIIEGDPESPLAPAHRSCNIRKSHEYRKQKRSEQG